MKDKRKQILSNILIAFILAGIAIFIVLAAGVFYFHFPDPAPLGVYEL
ncbi:MAG: hypothetical protein PHI59_02880 [Candidatus Omnitrophica bacterium]|nr:hypothetical protein [Candidatus Omnitrophota bacterium]